MDALERERLLSVVSKIVEGYRYDEDGEMMSLRTFAEELNSGHDIHELNVSYQTVKNWMDGVYLPRQSWLDEVEEKADRDSLVLRLAREVYNVIWTERSV